MTKGGGVGFLFYVEQKFFFLSIQLRDSFE